MRTGLRGRISRVPSKSWGAGVAERKKKLFSRIPLAERWLYRNDKALKSIRRGLQQARRMQLVSINEQNKFEVPIARKLGATLTHGSGSINGDGDMRLNGKYLIEHKQRNKEIITLPYKTFSKIRKAARSRNLTPVLIVSSKLHPSEDAVVTLIGDAFHLFGDSIRLHGTNKKYKQVRVGFPELIANVWMERRLNSVPVQELAIAGQSDRLAISHVFDFNRFVNNPAA